jgi:heterotetrameric sarcosine oxidase gamma subunit
MDSLRALPPLAVDARIVLPMLTVAALVQPTLSELRGSAAFREDPAYGQLPAAPGRSLDHGTWRANWIRPDGWLLIAAPQAGDARDTFAAAAQRKLCRIVDLSHSLIGLSLRGAASRDVLARGTPLDLRPRAFGPGCCTRTRCADFTVLLEHRPEGIDVYVDTSLAQAFWDWITAAAEHLRP